MPPSSSVQSTPLTIESASFPFSWQTTHQLAQQTGQRLANPEALPPRMLATTTFPTEDAPFLVRNPAMNKVRLFYSAFETELANQDAIQRMDEEQLGKHVIRLIPKRFIDYSTSKSYFHAAGVEKGNPGLHQQTQETRMLRQLTALQTIDNYPTDYLKEAYQHVLEQVSRLATTHPETVKQGKATVYITRPGRMEYMSDCTVNFLSLATQAKVSDVFTELENNRQQNSAAAILVNGRPLTLEFSCMLPGTVLSRTARSNADPEGRLVQQGYYDVSHFRENDLVVIADDHTQAGSTLLSLGSALMDRQAHVLACITPTLHPHASSLAMSQQTRAALQTALNKWDPKGKIMTELGTMGMSMDTLTDPEALILLAYATDPADSKAVKAFRTLDNTLCLHNGIIEKVAEGESDSLLPVLRKKFTVEEVLQAIAAQKAKSRNVSDPVRTQEVHVLDWDDFLRSEKILNYQLLHNAVVQLANLPPRGSPQAHQLPSHLEARLPEETTSRFFKALAEALAPENRLPFAVGRPEILRSENDYETFALANPGFTKKKMIRDLVSKAHTLSPELKEFDLNEWGRGLSTGKLSDALVNMLNTQFTLAYKALVRAKPDEGSACVHSRFTHSSMAGISQNLAQDYSLNRTPLDLPYPQIALRLMPRAQELLDKLRKPENRLVLISNRSHTDLQYELQQMNLGHYFDLVLGHEEVTNLTPQPVIQGRLAKKPSSEKITEAMNTLNTRTVGKVVLYGDRVSDLKQASNLPSHLADIPRQGVLVNAGLPEVNAPEGLQPMKQFLKIDPSAIP